MKYPSLFPTLGVSLGVSHWVLASSWGTTWEATGAKPGDPRNARASGRMARRKKNRGMWVSIVRYLNSWMVYDMETPKKNWGTPKFFRYQMHF